MKATRSKNFTKIEKKRVQQDGGNRRSYANVGYLANPAGSFVMPVGVGVRDDLQKEEKRKQRDRNDDGDGQPATRPGPC
jgi:hypothetical protein